MSIHVFFYIFIWIVKSFVTRAAQYTKIHEHNLITNENMTKQQQSLQSKTYQNQFMPDGGKAFFLDEVTADVHFSFGDGATRVAAHKIFLAAASDVFKRMFYGDLKENGDVNMVDVSEAAFKEFLQYFYLNEVKLTAENIAGVIQLGDKYNVEKCFDDGIQFLMDTINDENVFGGLQIGKLYDRPALVKACDTFIIVNTAEVLKSNGFLDCDKGMLEHILKMNVLSCSEVEVFEGCMAWVKAKSGEDSLSKEMVDTHLGELYAEIRFTTMSTHDLCALFAEYDAVLRSDFTHYTQMIMQSELKSGHFNSRIRHAKWNADAIVKCDRALGTEIEAYKLHCEEETTFSTNKPLLLGEFTCGKITVGHDGPDRDLSWNLVVDVHVTEAIDSDGTSSKTLLKMKAELQSKGTTVSLPHPVLIRPGFFYTIRMGRFPDEHCYYSDELKTEMRLESEDVMIEFYNCNVAEKDEKISEIISVFSFNGI